MQRKKNHIFTLLQPSQRVLIETTFCWYDYEHALNEILVLNNIRYRKTAHLDTIIKKKLREISVTFSKEEWLIFLATHGIFCLRFSEDLPDPSVLWDPLLFFKH